MKRLPTAPLLLAITLSITSVHISGQVRSAPVRPNRGGTQGVRGVKGVSQSAKGVSQVDAQARRNNRLPAAQQGINKPPPFGVPQAGRNRPLNPNQITKQQLQRRVMQAIGLTPDQRMRMQEIRRSHDDELIASGRRLRQARQALDRAIMSEPYNEVEVRKATEALAAAQSDRIRLNTSVRAQVRNVLTPDQVQRFNELQREMRREMKEQQQKVQEGEGTGASRPPEESESEEADLLALLSFIR